MLMHHPHGCNGILWFCENVQYIATATKFSREIEWPQPYTATHLNTWRSTLIVNHIPISIQARSTCTYKVQAHRWELSFSLIRYTQSIEVSLHLHVQISFIVHQLEKMCADATLNILLCGKVCKLGAHIKWCILLIYCTSIARFPS